MIEENLWKNQESAQPAHCRKHKTEFEDELPGGVLSGPEGYRMVIDKGMVPGDFRKMIENGSTLMLYLFSETDYFAAEVVITYLPVITIDIEDEADLSGLRQKAELTLYNSAATNKNMRYAESLAEVKIRGGTNSVLQQDIENDIQSIRSSRRGR